jgi:DNA (cytosine-5)-methyltransferase 1
MVKAPQSHSPRPVAIDLFAGAGGLSLGFEMAGFDVVSAVEYDPVHAATHLYNFPLTDTLCRDVKQITAEDLRDSAARGWALHNPGEAEWDGVIDVLIGGPSCQGFSIMGKQDEDDDRNQLIYEFVRLVEELRPRAFVMENVPGFLHERFAALRDEAFTRLRAAGYTVGGHDQILLASDFGVPQKRRRVVIAGTLEHGAPEAPLPTAETAVTVGEAFAGLPVVADYAASEADTLTLTDEDVARLMEPGNAYLQKLRSPESGYYAHPRRSPTDVLTGCKATVHKPTSVTRFAATEQGTTETVSRAYRLSSTKPALTLRAGTGRERGAFSASRPIHPTEPRVITVREAARLHSFPDWFRFHATNWHGHRQIGNAVPPLLAQAVARTVMDSLGINARKGNLDDVPAGDEALLALSPTTAAQRLGALKEEVPKGRLRQKREVADTVVDAPVDPVSPRPGLAA